MFVMDAQTMRAIDAATIQAGVEGLTLMERAGAGAAQAILRRPEWLWGTSLVLCGKGNNGGDGFVVARLLHGEGHAVRVVLLSPAGDYEGDAATNLRRASEMGVPFESLPAKDPADALRQLDVDHPGRLLVDGMLGTGFRPPLHERAAALVGAVADTGRRVVALDLPSGVDATTGAVEPTAVLADLTVTFGFAKWGLFAPPGRRHAGRIERVDLSFPSTIVREQVEAASSAALYVDGPLAAGWWRPRPVDAHKYSVGSVLTVGGSQAMSGAISLASLAALRAGAGLVEAVVPGSQRLAVDTVCPEVLVQSVLETGDGTLAAEAEAEILERSLRHAAVLLGPGAGAVVATDQLLVRIAETLDKPMVVDADALNAFARLQRQPSFPAGRVLTPHTGELARLLAVDKAQIDAQRVEVLQQSATKLQAVILHKGAPSMVAAPNGSFAVISSGGPALASAGTGDVLAGVVAALLAGGHPPFEAAALGAYMHGRAGDRVAERVGDAGLIARDLLDQLGPVGRDLADIAR